MVTLDQLIDKNHNYRKFKKLCDLELIRELKKVEYSIGADFKGYGIFRLFLCLLVQFMENLSYRELESLKSNLVSSKWFCEFNLTESTPNYSLFTRIRAKIGTNRLLKIFNILKEQLRAKSYMSEVFTFIDAYI